LLRKRFVEMKTTKYLANLQRDANFELEEVILELFQRSDVSPLVRGYFEKLCPVQDVKVDDVTILSYAEILRLRGLTVPEMLLWEMLKLPVIALEPNHDVYCLLPTTGEVLMIPASACLEEPYRFYDWEDECELSVNDVSLMTVCLERFANLEEFLESLRL